MRGGLGAGRQRLGPRGEIGKATVLHHGEIVVHRVDEKVGDQVRIGAHIERRKVLDRVVAHHQHVAAGEARRGEVLRVIGEVGLDARRVLERGDAAEQRRIDARPLQARLHRHEREHRHRREHERVALRGQRFDSAVQERDQVLHALALVRAFVERFEERLVVGDVATVVGHRFDAGFHGGAELLGVDPALREEGFQFFHIGAHELLDIHGKERAVQVEENRAVGAIAVRVALFHSRLTSILHNDACQYKVRATESPVRAPINTASKGNERT